MVCTEYQISFASDISKLKEIIHDITITLNEISSISEDALFDLRTVFNELLINAIIHGNKQNPAKNVSVTVQVEGDAIQSTIKDEGNGFDHTRYTDNTISADSLFKDSGRGLILAESLTDSLHFNEQGNEVEFILYI